MVEIECPEDPTWKSITIQYTSAEKAIELRLVSEKDPRGDRYNVPTAGAARCIAYLLLAAAEHAIEGKISDGLPLITRRASSDRVELRLWPSKPVPLATLAPATACRIAYGLMAESQHVAS